LRAIPGKLMKTAVVVKIKVDPPLHEVVSGAMD
jgi:hypothetical protein